MFTALTVLAVVLFIFAIFAIGFWLLRSQKEQQFAIEDTDEKLPQIVEDPLVTHTLGEEKSTTRNYYGQTPLPEPKNLRPWQTAPATMKVTTPVKTHTNPVYVAPSGRVVTETSRDPDLLDPLNVLSPLHPLSPISIWNQDEVREPSYREPERDIPIAAPAYEPTPSYEPSHSSWGGGHSGGAGAGSSWDSSPSSSYSSSDSYSSSSSYDSGSSSSYDSGSSSCDSGGGGGGCD